MRQIACQPCDHLRWVDFTNNGLTALGEAAGPSRLLCKFQNCTNPSCPFRHEDAEGKPIPPPALTAKKTPKATVKPAAPASNQNAGSDDDEIEIVATSPAKGKMDGVLDDSLRACRYAEKCTRGRSIVVGQN